MKEDESDIVSGTFTWKIESFSKLSSSKYYSEIFVVGGFKWRILIYPKGNNSKGNDNYLSLYLDYVPVSTSCFSGSTRLSLSVINHFDSKKSITKASEHVFKTDEIDWGFTSFMPLSEFCEKWSNFLVNDICIVEARVSVRKGDIKLSHQESGELFDFKGLGRTELAFHPLLEEVCSSHPLLIERQQKRSREFAECSFTTLGRLLYFLKTTKVKDMTQDGYRRLQNLWDELEAFKFDLSWLQPHVQSILGMKNSAGRLERLREDVDALENEIKRREALLEAAKVDLEKAKEELEKQTGEFTKMCDMDGELGYPIS